MNRSLEEVGLSRDAEEAQIGWLLITEVEALRREFDSLKRELRIIANRTLDADLVCWLRDQESGVAEDFNKVQSALTTFQGTNMAIKPTDNYEEAVAQLEHVEALAKLTRQ